MARPSSNVDDTEGDDHHDFQLALINQPENAAASFAGAGGSVVTSRYTGFTLPSGWRVAEVPRKNSRMDKFYFEPGTGRKFSSLRAVEKYLNDDDVQFYEKPVAMARKNKKRSACSTSGCSRKSIILDGKIVRYMEGMTDSELASLAASETAAKSHHGLPDGWVVEEVPRRDGPRTDKYYYEPKTGQKFRSLPAAKKHVADSNEDEYLKRPPADELARCLEDSERVCFVQLR